MLEEALSRVSRDVRVQGRTFDVFRSYVLKGEDADEVAGRYGLKKNAVYQIKDRLTRRLQDEVATLMAELGEE